MAEDKNKSSNNLVPSKTDSTNNSLTPTGVRGVNQSQSGARKVSMLPRLHVAAKQAEQKKEDRLAAETLRASMMKNRLGLMMDGSGSMSEPWKGYGSSTPEKIKLLRSAFVAFMDAVTWDDTAVAIETFPFNGDDRANKDCIRQPLISDYMLIRTLETAIQATGGTPMGSSMEYMLEHNSITRGILISDGEATDHDRSYDMAKQYKMAEIPIDCVHIGHEKHGEERLQKIAEITGGIYIKFTDVEAFAKAFVYLTPKFRAMLTGGHVDAKAIGADEIRQLNGRSER